MWRVTLTPKSRRVAAGGAALSGPFAVGYALSIQSIKPATLEPKKYRTLVSRPSVVPSKGYISPRDVQVKNLQTLEFDVLVVGGGATGAGAALDAATRGLRTALIERGDFGNETSSRSTKLIWAGIRYIATAISSLLRVRNVARPIDAVKDFWSEFKMVSSAHHERR